MQFNTFWVYVTPWVGGILADTKWGRYNTILIFSLVCLAGHIILVASASPAALKNSDLSLGLLCVAIVLMGLGAGCIKANVSPMIAEQYTGKMHKKTLKSGEVVVVSPAVTVQSIYLCKFSSTMSGFIRLTSSRVLRCHQLWCLRCHLCVIPGTRPRLLVCLPCAHVDLLLGACGPRRWQVAVCEDTPSWFHLA